MNCSEGFMSQSNCNLPSFSNAGFILVLICTDPSRLITLTFFYVLGVVGLLQRSILKMHVVRIICFNLLGTMPIKTLSGP